MRAGLRLGDAAHSAAACHYAAVSFPERKPLPPSATSACRRQEAARLRGAEKPPPHPHPICSEETDTFLLFSPIQLSAILAPASSFPIAAPARSAGGALARARWHKAFHQCE